MAQAHLIYLREPNPRVLDVIRKEWPDDQHRVELSDALILIKHSNGGKSVYELIQEKMDNPDPPFRALIVRVGRAHGYESASLWEWLNERE